MYSTLVRRLSGLTVCALIMLGSSVSAQEQVDPIQTVTEAELRGHIYYLASDFLEGRDAGTREYMLAAQYAAIHFHAVGLVPMMVDSSGSPSFFQQVRFGYARVDTESVMRVNRGGIEKTYRLGQEFAAQENFSSTKGTYTPGALEDVQVPLENIVLNINLDMVGRNSPPFPESLLALASENGRPQLLDLITSVNESRVQARLDLRLNEGEDPQGHIARSDQMAFIQRDIPAILLTRGFMGPDYHESTDDPETINYDKVLQAARLTFALAVEAANREQLFVTIALPGAR